MMMRTILLAAAALASVSFSPGHAESAAAPYRGHRARHR